MITGREYSENNCVYVTNKFLQKRYPTKGKYQYCSDADIDKCNDSILEKRLAKIKKINLIFIYRFNNIYYNLQPGLIFHSTEILIINPYKYRYFFRASLL